MGSCTLCGKAEVFYKRDHEGTLFCQACFAKNIEGKVKRTINKFHLLEPSDHVAVGVSGGKDSLSLMAILTKLESRFPRTRMTAVTVDEGIPGYRDESVQLAREYCRKLGVPQITVSYRELFGTTTHELAGTIKHLSPCSYCGVLRRKALNRVSAEIGATKIATAHNLDDEVQTVLLNLVHGDVTRVARLSPILEDPRGCFITRIKPLCEIPEKEVVLYAYVGGFEFQSVPCPYASAALRSDIRIFINSLEQKHPGVKFSLYRSAEKLREFLADRVPWQELNSCEKCGDPTPHAVCEGCLMLEATIKV